MDISDTFTETLTVKHKSGTTKEGDPTYGAGVTMKARIERASVTVSGGDGTQQLQEDRVFTSSPLVESDLVFFPEDSSADNDKGRRPARCQPMKDLDGVLSHYETDF